MGDSVCCNTGIFFLCKIDTEHWICEMHFFSALAILIRKFIVPLAYFFVKFVVKIRRDQKKDWFVFECMFCNFEFIWQHENGIFIAHGYKFNFIFVSSDPLCAQHPFIVHCVLPLCILKHCRFLILCLKSIYF